MTTMLPTVDPESRSLAGVLPDCLASLTVGGGSLPRADHAVIVLVDAATGRPTRLTQEMRDAWQPFTGASIEYAHR